MYRFIFFFLSASVFFSCYNNEKTAETTPPEIEVLPDESSKRMLSDSTQVPKTMKKLKEGKLVTYESCAAYAAATDYAFLDKDGKRILIRVNHFEDGKSPNPILPANMQESGENIEGPPGANPEMVGKEFKLIYDEKEENIIEILLVKE